MRATYSTVTATPPPLAPLPPPPSTCCRYNTSCCPCATVSLLQVMLDAQLKAYSNLMPIPRYRGHTIFHPLDVTQRKVHLW